ncbi:hypothetical protein [Nitrososphaeria virus YSH_462411]|uniref:Uncharacterized protein n=1 Tax=Nitrososphaeria virus YSH_462411 TaxID=3071321 RepID=A0A976YDV1_9CAUD|nr:hypothetical protein QKV92_gp46 [Yangshan Harbor Nitrososphaeria virus]UVF62318.1 hypothetical protein [Nitrososphaeria virus YSH_462411]
MRGNKSGYNAGRKKAVIGADRPKLDNITDWLNKNNFGVRVSESNKIIKINDHIHHETDLVLNNKVHLQHDTVKVHCELGYEDIENDRDKHRIKTLKRNSHYYNYNIPFCVLNQDLASMLNLNEGALTVYLYYHTLMLENARKTEISELK